MQQAVSLSAAEAAAFLGIKPQTLYAYASRGLLRRVGTGKRRRYLAEDLERLQARQRARSGHGPVAAAALTFGEPVLDTQLTGIDERGPRYRGRPAVELAESGASFESVAELLWTGTLPSPPRPELFVDWRAFDSPPGGYGPARSSLSELMLALPTLAHAISDGPARVPALELSSARRLVRSLAELLTAPRARRSRSRIAELLAPSTTAAAPAATSALDLALVLIADHELNASSFAARIAASTDASLFACITAALATLSGPRHGGACDRIEALLEEAAQLSRPSDVIERRLRRGDSVPGFGHPLYPDGDPRARPLLERARRLGKQSAALRAELAPAFSLASSMEQQGLPPTVDFGLVTLTRALGMRPGSAGLLFALGRSAGWAAHVFEQRASQAVLRPRARYVGP